MDRQTIRDLFLHPPHTTDFEVALGKPDGDAVHDLMVKRMGFDEGRVDGALAKYGAARGRQDQQTLFDF